VCQYLRTHCACVLYQAIPSRDSYRTTRDATPCTQGLRLSCLRWLRIRLGAAGTNVERPELDQAVFNSAPLHTPLPPRSSGKPLCRLRAGITHMKYTPSFSITALALVGSRRPLVVATMVCQAGYTAMTMKHVNGNKAYQGMQLHSAG
jgi:hypothetical protein